jgi:hypothetical protein
MMDDGVHMPIRIEVSLLTPVCIPIVHIHREIRLRVAAAAGGSRREGSDVHLAIPLIIIVFVFLT